MAGRSPVAAAVLNFLFWGAGYLYIEQRRVLGFGLTGIFIINLLLLLVIPYDILLRSSEILMEWAMLVWVLLSLLFAEDVYQEAKTLAGKG